MTDTSIRAELRRAAMAAPALPETGLCLRVVNAFLFDAYDGDIVDLSEDERRWFFLLVAEAL